MTKPGVDATNWRGEQAIRPAVVNRKVWGGNRTEFGAATQQGVDPIRLLVRLARTPDPHVLAGLGLAPT